MPVRGVPVGGRSVEASIVKYSTFNGRFYDITTGINTIFSIIQQLNANKINTILGTEEC